MESIRKFARKFGNGDVEFSHRDGYMFFRVDAISRLPEPLKGVFCKWEYVGTGPDEDGNFVAELYYKTKHQENYFYLGKVKDGELQACVETCAGCPERETLFRRAIPCAPA